VPKERNSTGMMVTGIVLTGVGVIALLSGAIVYTSANTQQTYDELCSGDFCRYEDRDDEKVAAAAVMIAGGAAIAIGIPLLVVGARKVPVRGGAGAPPGEPERRDRDDVEEGETSLVISPRSTGLRMTF
jgi:hypothetical protein